MRLPLVPSSDAASTLPGPVRTFRVRVVIPPDMYSPPHHRVHRMPPQGPALVAASVAPDGFVLAVTDLVVSVQRRPPALPLEWLRDEERILRHLRGTPDDALVALADELLDRVEFSEADAVAFSMDRHTQQAITALLARRTKERTQRPIIIGGIFSEQLKRLLVENEVRGIDIATMAETPPELRKAFAALRDCSPGRFEPAVDPIPHGGQISCAPDDWPVPDFGVYDLDDYRRDPFEDERDRFPGYDGSGSRHLVLPYHFTFDCQFACSFCQRGGTQSAKSGERAARDLATLAERFGAEDFFLADAQINLHAIGFAQALLDAKLGIRWSDSFRATPRKPGDMELMARSGCVGLTFGLESASLKVLKRMIKGHLPHHGTRVVDDAHAHEILTRVNFLTCFPGETRADFEETRLWLQAHAGKVDDIAPSSFYLALGSPVGQDLERYGIRVRHTREESDDYRYRKQRGVVAYDEVDGMTWEEREPLLRSTELELRETWMKALGERSVLDGMHPRMVFAVRRRFKTKAEAWPTMMRWYSEGRSADSAPRREGVRINGNPVGPPAIVSPEPLAPWVTSRFEEVMTEATPQLERFLGRRMSGHVFLFDDGDYLFFRGEVRDGTGTRLVHIDSILLHRLSTGSPRRSLYGRLSPGSDVELGLDSLTSTTAPPVPLVAGRDYQLVSFAPRTS